MTVRPNLIMVDKKKKKIKSSHKMHCGKIRKATAHTCLEHASALQENGSLIFVFKSDHNKRWIEIKRLHYMPLDRNNE